MTKMYFSWRDDKNRSNYKKHKGIAFEDAIQVFNDPLRLTRQDRYVDGEERWQTIGVVYGVTILLVAHTIVEENEDGQQVDYIHIISARRATPRERKQYENKNY